MRPWVLGALLGVAGVCLPPHAKSGRTQEYALRLLQKEWTSHQIVTEIAALLLRERLGFNVTVIPSNKPTVTSAKAISDLEADADPEVWNSVTLDPEFPYRPNLRVRRFQHDLDGRAGWYIPTYMVERFPDAPMRYFSHLRDPRLLELYAKNALESGEETADPDGECTEFGCADTYVFRPPHCGPSDCRAQVLHGPVGYEKGIFEQQIVQHRLNLSVVYLSEKSMHDRVWHMISERRPVIFHGWRPAPEIRGLPWDEVFTRVTWPPFNDACKSNHSPTPTGGWNCDFPHMLLETVVNEKLETLAPDAYSFFSEFRLRYSDYEELLSRFRKQKIRFRGDSVEAVRNTACKWARKHEDWWNPWIRNTLRIPFFPGLDSCWLWFYVQIVAGLVIFLGHNYCGVLFCSVRKRPVPLPETDSPPESPKPSPRETTPTRKPQESTPSSAGRRKRTSSFHAIFTAELTHTAVQDCLQEPASEMGFFNRERSEEAFVALEVRSAIPSIGPKTPLRERNLRSRWDCYMYLLQRTLPGILDTCAYCSLFVGALTTLLVMYRENVEVSFMHERKDVSSDHWAFTKATLIRLATSVDDFKFLPTFILSFYINREVGRWMSFLSDIWSIQGRLHDLGLLLGGAFTAAGTDSNDGLAKRSVHYRFYRYLNAVHALAYVGADIRLKDNATVLRLMQETGLLRDEELADLALSPKPRETVLTWVGAMFMECVDNKQIPSALVSRFFNALQMLRGSIGAIHDHLDQNPPHSMYAMMQVLVDILIGLIIVSYPFRLMMDSTCVQILPMITTFLLCMSYLSMIRIAQISGRSPFDDRGDCVNVDHVLCSTEVTLHTQIRAKYARSHEEQMKNGSPPRPPAGENDFDPTARRSALSVLTRRVPWNS